MGGVMATTMVGVDVSDGLLDHLMVQAEVDVVVPPSRRLVQRRVELIDRSLLRHPARVRILRAALAHTPTVP
eukprot:11615728-Alexandrium_andersonii.AAC.1